MCLVAKLDKNPSCAKSQSSSQFVPVDIHTLIHSPMTLVELDHLVSLLNRITKRGSMESAGEFDYIIVGAGTAGCVLANRLTRKPDVHVLLIEAGGKDDYLWIHIPVGYLHCIGNPRTDWLFKT